MWDTAPRTRLGCARQLRGHLGPSWCMHTAKQSMPLLIPSACCCGVLVVDEQAACPTDPVPKAASWARWRPAALQQPRVPPVSILTLPQPPAHCLATMGWQSHRMPGSRHKHTRLGCARQLQGAPQARLHAQSTVQICPADVMLMWTRCCLTP
jgi:hypothetical protein